MILSLFASARADSVPSGKPSPPIEPASAHRSAVSRHGRPRAAIGVVKAMSSLALAIAAGVPAVAQGEPAPAAAIELPRLRAAFAAAQACEHAAVITVVEGGEPVILTAGSDSSGEKLTPRTLVPLLALAKVLAADAIRCQLQDKIDEGSDEMVGGRELSVRELLDGVPALPDYFVLDGGDDSVDAALLKRCGAVAAGAGMVPQASRLGAPEFVLLEPSVLGERFTDWPSMLRTTLAPHVSGLNPVGADALVEQDQSRVLAIEGLTALARAQPQVLRTMLSLQNIGAWMQWRTQQGAPLWTSKRMGAMVPSRLHPKVQYWVTGTEALGLSMMLMQYPSRKAALLRIIPHGNSRLARDLQVAFESDLYADETGEGPSPLERRIAKRDAARAARAARSANGAPALTGLDGTRWYSVAADGKESVRLAFGASLEEGMVLTLDGGPMSLRMTRTGTGLRATPRRRGTDMYWLWLRPEPNEERPTKLTGVLVARRVSSGRSPRYATTASVPRYLELLREQD